MRTMIALAAALVLVGCSDMELEGDTADFEPPETGRQFGQFLPAVAGVEFMTATQRGVTNEAGIFAYLEGEDVTFQWAGSDLGTAPAQRYLSAIQLAETSTQAVNQRRFMVMPDEDNDETNGVSYSVPVRNAFPSWSQQAFDSPAFEDTVSAKQAEVEQLDQHPHPLQSPAQTEAAMASSQHCQLAGLFLADRELTEAQRSAGAPEANASLRILMHPADGSVEGRLFFNTSLHGVREVNFSQAGPVALQSTPTITINSQLPFPYTLVITFPSALEANAVLTDESGATRIAYARKQNLRADGVYHFVAVGRTSNAVPWAMEMFVNAAGDATAKVEGEQALFTGRVPLDAPSQKVELWQKRDDPYFIEVFFSRGEPRLRPTLRSLSKTLATFNEITGCFTR